MKIGRDTNSVTNGCFLGANGQPAPEIGMGVTILHWTDRSAGTISRLSASGKTFWYRHDIATRIDTNGMSEAQEYRYAPDPTAREFRCYRNRQTGAWKDEAGNGIRLGDRRAYHDFSF